MKSSILWVLISICTLLFFVNCESNKQFTVNGSFTKLDPTPVKLYLLSDNQSELIDSSFAESKEFILEGKIEYSGIYLVKFFNDQNIYLAIHPGDNIEIRIDNINDAISYYVDQSSDSKNIKELSDAQSLVLRQIDELSVQWESQRGDSALRRVIDSSYHSILRKHRAFSKEFIYANPNSLANIMALYQNLGRKSQTLFDPYDDLDIYNFVDSNLVKLYPQTEAVKALNREVNDIKAQIAERKYIEKIVEEGRPLSPFKYPVLSGDTLQFGNNQKKVVVMLFWASWNPYSVDELKTLNKFAQSKEARNISFVGVSLDTSEKNLNEFIVANNITIPIVCDYQYWDSEIVARYAAKRIPSTLLANKEGIIVAKDIFSEELYNRLKEIN